MKVHTKCKERSEYRQQIVSGEYMPFVQDGVWNGRTMQCPNGGFYEIQELGDGMRKQLRLMVTEGYFGNLRIIPSKGGQVW